MNKIYTSIVERPWGEERWINSSDPLCKVKLLTVKKGESLSLQFHKQRSEFWKILTGSAKVKIGDREFEAKPGDEFFVPELLTHQISGLNEDCTFLEVSSGVFDQEDIVRLEDKYGRIKKE